MDITLALGGGGSRGVAHIGVIRRLIAEGFRIRAVAGTSAGGIVAALLAAGFSPDQMEAAFAKVDQSKLFGRASHAGPSILGLTGAEKLFHEWLGERTFSDLVIPCALTAVDLQGACEVVLRQGRVVDAILATIALPGIFPPHHTGEHQLVDGGVLDPVPVSIARLLEPALPVVAVVLTPLVETASSPVHIPLPIPVPGPLVERITRLRVAQAFTIFLQAVDVSGKMLTELRLKIDAPEVILRPNVSKIGLLDAVDVHELIRLGEQAVEPALDDLKRAVSWPKQIRRKLFKGLHSDA
ncbi:MAG: patatin-like phospholipase family protein [Chloroflexota bacterium]